MKKYLVLAGLVVIALAMIAVQPAVQTVGANDDHFICHIEDKKLLRGHVISVNVESLRGHILAHGNCQFVAPVGTPCEVPCDCD